METLPSPILLLAAIVTAFLLFVGLVTAPWQVLLLLLVLGLLTIHWLMQANHLTESSQATPQVEPGATATVPQPGPTQSAPSPGLTYRGACYQPIDPPSPAKESTPSVPVSGKYRGNAWKKFS